MPSVRGSDLDAALAKVGVTGHDAELTQQAIYELGLVSAKTTTGSGKSVFDAFCELLEQRLAFQVPRSTRREKKKEK